MSNINTKEYDLALGDTTVKLFIKSSDTSGINFINVHQNEVTSKGAGEHILQQFGGYNAPICLDHFFPSDPIFKMNMLINTSTHI